MAIVEREFKKGQPTNHIRLLKPNETITLRKEGDHSLQVTKLLDNKIDVQLVVGKNTGHFRLSEDAINSTKINLSTEEKRGRKIVIQFITAERNGFEYP